MPDNDEPNSDLRMDSNYVTRGLTYGAREFKQIIKTNDVGLAIVRMEAAFDDDMYKQVEVVLMPATARQPEQVQMRMVRKLSRA
jgi:hypothetical protein